MICCSSDQSHVIILNSFLPVLHESQFQHMKEVDKLIGRELLELIKSLELFDHLPIIGIAMDILTSAAINKLVQFGICLNCRIAPVSRKISFGVLEIAVGIREGAILST